MECDHRLTGSVWSPAAQANFAETDARLNARLNANAARERADWLYCDMQGQMAANATPGILMPLAAYGQAQNSCLKWKAAERAAEQ